MRQFCIIFRGCLAGALEAHDKKQACLSWRGNDEDSPA
jgi:hypothetical protein